MKALKLKQKLCDWKTWAFGVLPIALIVAAVAICIYCEVTKRVDDVPLLIVVFALFDVAVCLMVLPSSVNRIKEKHYVSAIVALLAFACYIGLRVAVTSFFPALVAASNERDARYEEYQQTAWEDPDHKEKLLAWSDSVEKYNDIALEIKWLQWGAYIAVCAAEISLNLGKKKEDEQPAPQTQSNEEQPEIQTQNGDNE